MRTEWFYAGMRAGRFHSMTVARTVPEAIRHLTEQDYDVVYLDYDLGTEPGGGREVARWLIGHPERSRQALIICHSVNGVSGPKIERALQAGGREARWIPFPMLLRI